MPETRITSYREFYPFYLSEHQQTTSRLLHFIGTLLFFLFLFSAIATQNWYYLLFCPAVGYGFAWIGHFFFEKNKPATFKYPLWSLISDFRLFFELLIGKQKFKAN